MQLEDTLSEFPDCPLTYTYSVMKDGNEVADFPVVSFDNGTLLLGVFYSGDQVVALGGDDENGIDYVIKITATGPTYKPSRGWLFDRTVILEREFTLNLLNPCFDSSLVSNFTPL